MLRMTQKSHSLHAAAIAGLELKAFRSLLAEAEAAATPTPDSLRRLVNAQDQAGATPLHCAAYSHKPYLIAELIKLGADPNIKDEASDLWLAAMRLAPFKAIVQPAVSDCSLMSVLKVGVQVLRQQQQQQEADPACDGCETSWVKAKMGLLVLTRHMLQLQQRNTHTHQQEPGQHMNGETVDRCMQQQSEGLPAMLSVVGEVFDVCTISSAAGTEGGGGGTAVVKTDAIVAAQEQLTLDIVDAVNEVVDAAAVQK
eukprot:gene9027-9198_t